MKNISIILVLILILSFSADAKRPRFPIPRKRGPQLDTRVGVLKEGPRKNTMFLEAAHNVRLFLLNKSGKFRLGDTVRVYGHIKSPEDNDKYRTFLFSKIKEYNCCEMDMRGDINLDGLIDVGDIVMLVELFYHKNPPYICENLFDLNGDGFINEDDIDHFALYMGADGPPPVPCEDD